MIRLVCLDMEGVLVKDGDLWMALHRAYGTEEEGKRLTEEHLQGDYAKLVEEVVGRLWKGKPAAAYLKLVGEAEFMPGIEELFSALDRFEAPRAIITGAPYELALRIQARFRVDFIFANQLVIRDGIVTGEFKWPVGAGGYSKREVVEQVCDDLDILPQEVLYVGDGDNDIEAFRIAGVSVAFNSKSDALREAATHVVEGGSLAAILPILEGLPR